MKLVVGLGNPGKRYEKTRHNAGYLVLDELKSRISNFQFPISNEFQISNFKFQKRVHSEVWKVGNIILAKPQTFMNDSGKAVTALATFYKLSATDIYVIHDDLDIALGEYKIQKGKGPRDHNGLSSIDKALGTREYWHVRVGIENRRKKLPITNYQFPNKFKLFNFPNFKRKRISGEKFVLQNFTEKELKIIDEVADKVVGELSNDVLNR